jgi:pyruvate,water dikinase
MEQEPEMTTIETTEATGAQAGTRAAPPDFPVTWERPGDDQFFWTTDRMHYPEPVAPLEFDFFTRSWEDQGLNVAARAYSFPFRAQVRRINSYPYSAQVPVATQPEELAALGKEAEARLGQAMGRVGEAWRETYLPEVKQFLDTWSAFDLAGATLPDLMEHFGRTLAAAGRMGEIHMLAVLPGYLGMGLFDELYRDLFGTDDPFGAHRLLQGLSNKTVEVGRELWKLSRRALALPEVRRVLEEQATADVIPALKQTETGRAFFAELRAYLEAYGQRGDKWGITHPYWIEDPTPAIKNLKDYAGQPDRDLIAEQAQLAAEREQAVAQARERLQGYPDAVRGQFEFLLKAAQEGATLSEDHGFYIDFCAPYQMRRAALEVGRRLAAAGAIARAEDVMLLFADEVRETARQPPSIDRQALVDARRAEMERFGRIQPPRAIGTPPPGPPPDSPVVRTFAKFWGTPPPASDDPHVLRGTAGAAGSARGTAKVVRSIGEAAKLQRGDILVAETTAPPWTPLFATVAAVVTDTGGVLSHCAVVAREFHIPAVVGTGRATAAIRDGQLLEVDGNAGTVRILSAG